MNIFVFDDNKAVCDLLAKTINEYVHKNFEFTDIEIFGTSSVEKTEGWIEINKPDIAVLDIAVKNDDLFGIELAKKIRKKYRDCHIVFISSDSEKITKIFSDLIRPTQFIVKGKDFSKLNNVICDVLRDSCDYDNALVNSVKVSFGRNEYILNSSEIVLIRKSGRKTEIVLENRMIEVADTVSGIANMLPSHFKFVDKGVVLNLKRVSEAKYAERSLVLDDGRIVYMSRNSVHEIKATLAELIRRNEKSGVAVN